MRSTNNRMYLQGFKMSRYEPSSRLKTSIGRFIQSIDLKWNYSFTFDRKRQVVFTQKRTFFVKNEAKLKEIYLKMVNFRLKIYYLSSKNI